MQDLIIPDLIVLYQRVYKVCAASTQPEVKLSHERRGQSKQLKKSSRHTGLNLVSEEH